MKYTVKAEEMYEAENSAFEKGLNKKDAMLSAGCAVFERVKQYKNVLVVAFCGNNGGDGFVCAQKLRGQGTKTDVLLLGDTNKLSEHAKFFYNKVKDLIVDKPRGDYDCVVDALFGIGFHGSLAGKAREYAELINGFKGRAKIVSVDMPSGLDAFGQADYAVSADETVTFAAIKYGQIIGHGADYTGEITVADIKIKAESDLLFAEKDDIKPLLPKMSSTAHKGTRGHVGVIASSFGMEGAGMLSAISALRASAGKASLCVPEECKEFYFSRAPEVMLAVRKSISDTENFIKDKDVVVFGPGIGRNEKNNEELLECVLSCGNMPLIIDADGLYYLTPEKLKQANRTVILTPHMGEAARLFNISIKELMLDPKKYAAEFFDKTGATVLLKSNFNLIAGKKNYITVFGCPAMATAGSGDVLSGIAGGAMCLTRDAESACLIATFVHGTAGRYAMKEKTEYSVCASDISENIYKAFGELV